ncbi:Outer membrane protein assembly factor BamB [Candidatus Methanoperedenaceae archaeon GB50]|nr:Outer membrane protein assembly factor BamB [Candidatus Methanoperedenaceae archaeon GB50]CAD7778324.1 MAG: Outer membrane protein assembly factor BamB [Candidatus Methanoperedenaceae archaeon GB50]
MKKKMAAISIVSMIFIIMVTTAVPVAAQVEWSQFQKDEVNTGVCNEKVIGRSVSWNVMTHTNQWMAAGINVVPIVAKDVPDHGDVVFVLDCTGNVSGYNVTTGDPIWSPQFTMCNAAEGSFELSTPAYHDGILYVATSKGNLSVGEGRVTAIYARNGTIREYASVGSSGYQLNTPITYADGKIYVGSWKGTSSSSTGYGTYYCLNASNVSDLIWERTAPYITGYNGAGAAIIGDYIVYGDDKANVTCLNKDDGTFISYFNVSEEFGITPVEEIRSSIMYNDDTGRIYFTAKKSTSAHGGYGDGHLYAVEFDETDGTFNDTGNSWVYDLWHSTSTPVYHDGRIYVGGGQKMYSGNCPDGKVCCVNAADGSLIWEWNNTVDPQVDCLRVKASPAIAVHGSDLYIYVTSNNPNGRLYCLNENGEMLWYYEPSESSDSGEYISQGATIYNNSAGEMRVFFGNDAGKLYALDEGMCGDVNADGTVNAFDVAKVRKRATDPNYYLNSPWAADATGDGAVNAFDVAKVRKRAADPNYILNCCCDD